MKKGFLLLLVIFSLSALTAQNVEDEPYYKGLNAFRQGEYQKAYQFFDTQASDETSPFQGDALFWAGKSLMADENLEDSSLLLDQFILKWPDSRYFEEAQYLRGRIFFLQAEYANTLDYFLRFTEDFDRSPYVPNALYWMAESLFQLGKIPEAKNAFQELLDNYPDSYKVEAARYRLSLIDLSSREAKLMELLRWSHEEFLKSSQENLETKQEYEEALKAYQQQILSLSQQENFYEIQMELLSMKEDALDLKAYYLNELDRLSQ